MTQLRLLALDQADQTGWCVYIDGKYHTGHWKMDPRKSTGERLGTLYARLGGLRHEYKFERIGYEVPVWRGKLERPKTLRHLHHIEAVIHMFADAKELPIPVGFGPDEWRKSALGSQYLRAPRGMKEADRKRWHEDNARFLCKTLGLEIENGNEAESVGVMQAFLAYLKINT